MLSLAGVARDRNAWGPTNTVVDIGLTLGASRGLTASQAAMRRAIKAGCVWTVHESLKAGYVQECTCQYCGAEQGGIAHLFWVCPTFSGLGRQVEGHEFFTSHEELPPTLALFGWSPLRPLLVCPHMAPRGKSVRGPQRLANVSRAALQPAQRLRARIDAEG